MEKYLIYDFSKDTAGLVYGREPVVNIMPDKSLVCFFLTGGTTEPENANFTAISRSFDGGRTWTKPEKCFDYEKRGVWTTEIFSECETPFCFVQTYNAESYYCELKCYMSYTKDSGKTWEPPASPKGLRTDCSVRKGIKLSNGDLLFPLYWLEQQGGFEINEGKWRFRTSVGISHDGGKTFENRGYITMDGINELWEPNAIETEPGHVIMYCRNASGKLAMTQSFDYGKSWSTAELSDIPNANTKLTLFKIDGTVFLLNNFCGDNGFWERKNLCIYKSRNGIDFEKVLKLEDEAFFYPHAAVDSENKKVLITYENTKQHYAVHLSFAELGL